MKALTPCAVAAALEVVAGAEAEVLEDSDEDVVSVVEAAALVLEAEAPVPEAVAELVKVTPTARHVE